MLMASELPDESAAMHGKKGAGMLFNFETMSASEPFEVLTSTVVPRPIALVTILSVNGAPDAAPYSFFNIIGIEPPVLALTVLPGAGRRHEGYRPEYPAGSAIRRQPCVRGDCGGSKAKTEAGLES